jgi:sporulation protein YlmC with PRC-barrel domain
MDLSIVLTGKYIYTFDGKKIDEFMDIELAGWRNW